MRASSFDRGPTESSSAVVPIAAPPALTAVHLLATASRAPADLARQVWDAIRDGGWSLLGGTRQGTRRA